MPRSSVSVSPRQNVINGGAPGLYFLNPEISLYGNRYLEILSNRTQKGGSSAVPIAGRGLREPVTHVSSIIENRSIGVTYRFSRGGICNAIDRGLKTLEKLQVNKQYKWRAMLGKDTKCRS